MTIMDAIFRLGELKPNGYSQSEKIKWLSTLDGIIKREIIDIHESCGNKECPCCRSFNGYNDDSALTTELLVPAPYDDIYLRWLEAQIDYATGETARYNNSMDAYNSMFIAFQTYYNRTHMPISKGSRFKF